MRCNWQRWLWGLIPLMLLGWAAITFERERVQADLSARAQEALTETGSPWASVSAEGRDVTLTGRAIQDDEPPRAADTVREMWGVRVVENRATLPPTIEPFTWSARKRGNRLRLSGYVPDRATRQTLLGLTKAAMPGAEVSEKLRTARGMKSPDAWLAGLSFALKQLSMLKNGEAKFENLTLTISGEAEDPAAFKTVNTALKSGLPKGITLASAKIAAPVVSPFTWSAQFAGGQLVLAGHVAGGEETRQDLMDVAKKGAPDANTVDRMESAEGAPQGWRDVAVAVLKELARLESGTAEMKDAALTLGGVAQDDAQADSIRSALRASIPSSFTFVDQIRVREVKAPEPPPPPPPPAASPSEPVPSVSMIAPSVPDLPAKPAEERAPDPPPAAEPQVATSEPAPPTAPAPQETEPASVQVPEPPAVDAPAQTATAPEPPAAEPEPKALAGAEHQAPGQLPGQSPAAEKTPDQQVATAPASPPEQPAKPAAQPAETPAVTPPAEAPAMAPSAEPAPRVEMAAPHVPPPQGSPQERSCQEELNKITSAGHIHFATDSAKLDSASFETLDQLAAAAKACPGVRIAIEGHTDAEGRAEYNQRLSMQRAQAVVSYLTKAGAERKQFVTVGYGPSRPAAPNDSEENMAKNRRIEFSVRQQ